MRGPAFRATAPVMRGAAWSDATRSPDEPLPAPARVMGAGSMAFHGGASAVAAVGTPVNISSIASAVRGVLMHATVCRRLRTAITCPGGSPHTPVGYEARCPRVESIPTHGAGGGIHTRGCTHCARARAILMA